MVDLSAGTADAATADRRARFAAAAVAASCALLVVAVNVSDAGYFARSWGWIAVLFLSAAAVTLATSDRVVVAAMPLAFLAAMTAFVLWVALSATWSQSAARSIREVERDVVYLALAGLIAAGGARLAGRWIVAGTLAGGTAIASYALATRLFPERLGVEDPFASFRLAAPIGYANGLGVFAAMTITLGVGVAVRGRHAAGRSLAAAALVPTAATLYFTFSRASWLALCIALAVAVVLDPGRLGLLARLPFLAALPAVGVGVSSQQSALTHIDAPVEAASREGHRLVVVLVVLAVLQVGVSAALGAVAARVRPSRAVLTSGNRLLFAVSVGAAVAAMVAVGGPGGAAERARDAFVAPSPLLYGDLNRRLYSLSGTGRPALWRVAWDVAREHPVAGAGAGTFEVAWLRRRPDPDQVRDAHNLYLETLSELGSTGLFLLLVTFAVPLVAAWRRRASPLVPAAAGAFVAYVAEVAVDWQWELVGVTLVAFLCAASVLVGTRGRTFTLGWTLRGGALVLTLALAVFALASLVGNRALSAGRERYAEGALDAAVHDARLAERLLPWSAEPLGVRGAAEFRSGAEERGRETLRRAVARDPSDWLAWYRLALASEGRERAGALAQARRRNPLEPLLRER